MILPNLDLIEKNTALNLSQIIELGEKTPELRVFLEGKIDGYYAETNTKILVLENKIFVLGERLSVLENTQSGITRRNSRAPQEEPVNKEFFSRFYFKILPYIIFLFLTKQIGY